MNKENSVFLEALSKIHDLTKHELNLVVFLKSFMEKESSEENSNLIRKSFSEIERELLIPKDILNQTIFGLNQKKILQPVKRIHEMLAEFSFCPTGDWKQRIVEQEEQVIYEILKKQKHFPEGGLQESKICDLAQVKPAFESYEECETSIHPASAVKKRIEVMLEEGKLIKEKDILFHPNCNLWKKEFVLEKIEQSPVLLERIFNGIKNEEKKEDKISELTEIKKEQERQIYRIHSSLKPGERTVPKLCTRGNHLRPFQQEFNLTPGWATSYQVVSYRVQKMLEEGKLILLKNGRLVKG